MKAQTPLPGLSFRLPPEPARLLRTRERVRDYLRHHLADPREIDDIVLCVEEACTNAIRHSGSDEDVTLSLMLEAGRLHVVVTDQGCGFDPALLACDDLPDPSVPGGRGLFLMTRLMDEVSVSRNGGTQVHMAKVVRLMNEEQLRISFAREAAVESPQPAGELETRLAGVLDSITDGFVALDWDWRYVYANPKALEMLRLPSEVLLGGRVWDLFPEVAGSIFDRHYRQAMEEGVPSRFEFYYDPHHAWYELRVYPASFGISVYFMDVTERKRTEDALRESEQRLRLHLQHTPLAVIEWDSHHVVTRWAGEAESIFGWKAAERVGRSAMDLNMILPDDLPILEQTLARLEDPSQQNVVSTTRNLTKDGRVVECTWYNSILPDEAGNVGSVLSLVVDNTERRQAEQALKESEAKYRKLFDSIDQGFFLIDVILDEDGQPVDLLYVEANQAAVVMLGADYTGRRLTEISPQYERYWFDIFGEVAATGRSVRLERYATPDQRWYDFFVFKIGGPESRRVGNIFRDVTERKRREANQAFLAGVTRDFGRLSTEEELIEAVGARVGRHLGVTRLFLMEIDEGSDTFTIECVWQSGGVPDVRGTRRLSAFGTEEGRRRARAGEPVAVSDLGSRSDAQALDAFRVGAFVCAPVQRRGVWSYLLTVDQPEPRQWRADEVELVAELAQILVPRLERARAEVKLRASEQRLRETVRAAGAGTWDWDAKTDVFTWSPELFELFGLEADQQPSLALWQEVLHTKDRDAALESIAAALRVARELDTEYRVLRNGEVCWIHALGKATFDAGGAPVRMGGICLDITERKRLQAELSRKEEQARHLIRNAPAAIYEIDFRGPRLTSVNDYMCELSGYTRAELLAMNPLHLLAEKDRARFLHRAGSTLTGGRTTPTVEYAVLTKSGEERHAVLDVTPLLEDGMPVGAFVVGHDVTERRRAEEALRESERRYRRLFERLQDGFVHELPHIPGLELAAVSVPAFRPELIGGDFHDAFLLPDGRVLAFIGDVMGKGIRAAGLTETVRSAARAVSLSSPSPSCILAQVNRLLMAEEHEEFVSLLVLIIDPATGKAEVASAGHPPAARLSAGKARLLEVDYGPPLGTFDVQYAAQPFVLDSGETLVLYTDGVTEARRGRELFGEQGLLRLLGAAPDARPAVLVEHVRNGVVAHADELKDDLQIMALRRN